MREHPLRNPFRNHPMTFLPEPTPEARFCPGISVDDPLLEPPNLFVDRVPRHMRADAPHVEYDEGGIPYWITGQTRQGVSILNGAVGRPIKEWDMAPQKYEEFRRGVFDVHERVKDMDFDGVWASLAF